MELRIKEVLKSQEMTTATLADNVGITRANMSNIVNGKTTPSLPTLQKIADALGVSIVELFAQPKNEPYKCPKCGANLQINIEVQNEG